MLTDEEIGKLLASNGVRATSYWAAEKAIREAVRLCAERCAEICDHHYKRGDRPADCAAAIRERIKDKPNTYFNPNEGFGPI